MGLPPSHADQRQPRATPAARVDEQRRADGTRELVLLKAEQRYRFTCAAGEESRLLEQLRRLARDPGSGIDWFDAALLSHQLGAQLSERLHRATGSGPDDQPPPASGDAGASEPPKP